MKIFKRKAEASPKIEKPLPPKPVKIEKPKIEKPPAKIEKPKVEKPPKPKGETLKNWCARADVSMKKSKMVARALPYLTFLEGWLKKGGIHVEYRGYVSLAFYFAKLAAISSFIIIFTLATAFLVVGKEYAIAHSVMTVSQLLSNIRGEPSIQSLTTLSQILSTLGEDIIIAQALSMLPMIFLVPIMSYLIVFFLFMIYPYSKLSERRTNIEIELPFTAAYMSILTSAGSPPGKVFEHMAGEAKLFGALGDEIRIIARDIVMFGRGIVDALEAACLRSPSQQWNDLLKGAFGSIQSGGLLSRYFHEATLNLMEFRKTRFERFRESLSRYAIISNSVLSVGPLVMAIMLCIMGIFGGKLGGLPVTMFLILLAAVIIPLIAFVLILMLDAITPHFFGGGLPAEEELRRREAKRSFYRAAILGAFVSAMVLIVRAPIVSASVPFLSRLFNYTIGVTPLILGIALGLVPIVLWDVRFHRLRDEMERNLPNLLRDIAEAQKTGMSFVEALKRASEKEYGPLSKELTKVCNQMAAGVTYDQALLSMADRVKSRLVNQAVSLIVEAGRSGGDIRLLMEQIAHYISELQILEERRKAEMKGYEYEVYATFGVFLFSLTMIFTVLISTVSAVAAATPTITGFPFIISMDVEFYRLLFFFIAISEAVCGGLVSGKIGGGTVFSGLKHIIVLLLVTTLVFNVFIKV